MLIAYLAIGYVTSLSWDFLSQPSTSVNQFSDMPSLNKKVGALFTVHQLKSEFEMATNAVLGVEWSKSNAVAPKGRRVWIIPFNDIPAVLNRKQDSTSSPKQVSYLAIADCEKTGQTS